MGSDPLAPTMALRKQLVSALVVSHLDYCAVVYLDMSEEQHTRLQRLQNACVRYVCRVRKSERIHRMNLDWIDVKARRTYFMAVLMYKLFYVGRPSYLAALLKNIQSRTADRAPRELEHIEAKSYGAHHLELDIGHLEHLDAALYAL